MMYDAYQGMADVDDRVRGSADNAQRDPRRLVVEPVRPAMARA